ncbi:MAG: HD domain-containing protein [Actinobacteria bacterium]|nr:HD domain-containing protein [Actinomycetota bacterium]
MKMIRDLKPGQKITEFFMVRSKELRSKKNDNGFYLALELGDASGRIFGSLWDNVEETYKQIKEGEPAKIRAIVIDWKGRPHLSIERARPAKVSDKLNLDDFIPKANENEEKLLEQFYEIIKNVRNEHLSLLLKNVFMNEEIKSQIKKTPAGKLWHHCYEGGLIVHTLAVTKIVENLCKLYPKLNRDLAVAGALLHDIGKITEYETKGYIDYSDEGRLHGHIAIGFHYVASKIEDIDDFPPDLKNQLLHLILTHQGSREHGSPVEPMTREAFILYYADEIDSKLNAFERVYEREHEEGRKWSNFVKLLNRFFYFGSNDTEKREKKKNYVLK